MNPSDLNDDEAIALTIYGEARGEKIEGQIAVGCVIRNRLDRGFAGKRWKDVCFEPKQFSCWNEDDPNHYILIELAEEVIKERLITNPTLKQCLWIAAGITDRFILDNTGGARNYLTTALYNQHSVQWANGMKVSEVIDHHTFLV